MTAGNDAGPGSEPEPSAHQGEVAELRGGSRPTPRHRRLQEVPAAATAGSSVARRQARHRRPPGAHLRPGPVGAMTLSAAAPPRHSWIERDLGAVVEGLLSGTVTRPLPTVGRRSDGTCLFYPHRVNTIFGESGDGKSFVGQEVARQEITAGTTCCGSTSRRRRGHGEPAPRARGQAPGLPQLLPLLLARRALRRPGTGARRPGRRRGAADAGRHRQRVAPAPLVAAALGTGRHRGN